MANSTEQTHLTVEEVAARYRTSPSTIHGWLLKGVAPPSLRVGKRRLFPLDKLIDWEAAHVDQPRPAA